MSKEIKLTRIKFAKEKETKNTIRYKEVTDGPEVIGTLYIKKWVVQGAEEVLVTLEFN
jgi:hypothetical protein